MSTEKIPTKPRAETLSPELHQLLAQAIERTGGEFRTLGKTPATNVVVNLTSAGLLLVTGKTDAKEATPQLVPAWMLETAWTALRQRGSLSNKALLSELRVMRSSAVCAILATLPGVRVEPGAGIVLVYTAPASETRS